MRLPHIIGDAGVTDEVRRLRDRFRYPDELGGSDDAAIPIAGGGGIPTLFIAASDALQSSKDRADFVCDGTADEVQWQAAVDALGADGGRVWGSEGTFTFSATVNLPAADNIHIEGMGWQATKIIMADGVDINLFTLNDADTNLVVLHAQLHGNADNNAAGRGLLVSAAASVYVTHCQLREFDTAAADITAQFVNQVVDSLIQECPIGVIYRSATGRGHLTGNDFENNTTDISIVDTAGTVVVANRSVGATTFLSRTAGDVYAWANDDGGAAYAGTIISAHNSSGTGDHSDVAALSARKLIDDEGDDRWVVEDNGDITGLKDDGVTPFYLFDQSDDRSEFSTQIRVATTGASILGVGADAGIFYDFFHDGSNLSGRVGHSTAASDDFRVHALRGNILVFAEDSEDNTGADFDLRTDDSGGTLRRRYFVIGSTGDQRFYKDDGSISQFWDDSQDLWKIISGDFRVDTRLDINNGIALGGGAAPTLGTIGGSGPTAAAQAQWVEIDIGGTAHWIPVWT